MNTPRVAAIHDLSGFGRCSLSVAMPILSAMGAQCCPMPTALLSTHTGGFQGFTFLDLTEEMKKIAAHWKALDLRFEAIYSGFLASEEQIEVVEEFLYDFRRPDTLVVIDPVMGDNGVLYQTYTPALCQGMARLAQRADVITPNLTEAALLLELPFDKLPPLRETAERLSMRGKRSVVLTGVTATEGKIGAMCFDAKTCRTEMVETDYVPETFHGTGDVFASVLTGALLRGKRLAPAAQLAAKFVRACAERSAAQHIPMREGVDFEPLLGYLTEDVR